MRHALLLTIAGLSLVQPSISQTFVLDTTFSIDGKVTTDYLGNDERGRTIAIQTDGKIIVAGKSNNDFILIRYKTNGAIDSTFDNDGIVTTDMNITNDEGKSLAIQNNGKILLAGITTNTGNGNANFGIVRYHSNGSLDTTFSNDGKQTTPIASGIGVDEGKSMIIQPDGKILVAGQSVIGGYSDFSIIRYDTTGTLDTTFDADGKVTTGIGGQNDEGNCVKLQSDGKILVAGYSFNGTRNEFAVIRYNANGSLDTTFDNDGKVTVSVGDSAIAFAMEIQNDKKILLAGISYSGTNKDFAVIRLDTTGTPDNNFDLDGKVITSIGTLDDECKTMVLQSDGKIILGGMSHNGTNKDFALIRYNTDGSIDSTFDADGRLTTDFANATDDGFSMLVQPADGKIILCGETQNATLDFAIARYESIIATGISQLLNIDRLSVLLYPNPCNHLLIVNINDTKVSSIFLTVYNSLGQLVLNQQLHSEETSLYLNLSSGIYHYTILNNLNKTISNGKLVVQ